MDPGFFADPDTDFKNPKPDPSIFGFNLPKKYILTKIDTKLNIFLTSL